MTPDSTRRKDVAARPIRLADGADWGFARPTTRLFPRIVVDRDPLGRPVERVAVGIEFGYPLEVRKLVDRLRAAHGSGTVRDQYEAFLALAACLLRRAHEIGPDAACALLAVSDDELPRLVREVMAIVSEEDRLPESRRRGGTDL